MIVGQRLDSHASANDSDDEKRKGDVPFPLYLGYNVDSEESGKNLDEPYQNLIEVNIEPEFVQTQQRSIIDELH
jgi:hypothetical protein